MSKLILMEKNIGSGTYGFVSIVKENENSEVKALKVYNCKKGGIYMSLKEIDVFFRIQDENLVKGHNIISKRNMNDIFGDNLTATLLDYYQGNLDEFCDILHGYTNEKDDEIKKDEENDDDEDEDMKFLNSLTKFEEKKFNKVIPRIMVERSKKTILILDLMEKMISQISSAFATLYQKGYYHLDIKPQNILFKCKNEIYSKDDVDFTLSDYGLCIPRDSLKKNYQYISGPWEIGTYDYLPPETLKENVKVYPASATWMLAISAVEMLYGSYRLENRPKFKKDEEQWEFLLNSSLDIRETIIGNFEIWYEYQYTNEETADKHRRMSKKLSGMMHLKFSKRLEMPLNINNKKEEKSYILSTSQKNLPYFFKKLVKSVDLFESDTSERIYIREFCLAWYYVCRLVSKNRININMNYEKEISKCLELAKLFYDPNSVYPFFLKPEKILVNFINELDRILFTNPIFMMASNEDEIYSLFEELFKDENKYIEQHNQNFSILGNGIETENKNSFFTKQRIKNVTFEEIESDSE